PQGRAGARAARAPAAQCDGGPERPRGRRTPVRPEPHRDRRAEREDRRLYPQARVPRGRGGARCRGERPAAGLRARGGDRAVPAAAAAPRVTVRRAARVAVLLAVALLPLSSSAADRLAVRWHPVRPRIGDVAWLHVRGGSETAVVEGSVGNRPVAEGLHLTMLYRTVSPERLWRGAFVRPVAGTEPPSGFGARRIINGRPRAAHGGADYRAPQGTPVVAANAGRVALVGDYFFPGRLIALDHGLGLYTLYFHLDSVAVSEGERVDRGQPIGTVGATGRATGPHLHFGAQLGSARVDPAALLALRLTD